MYTFKKVDFDEVSRASRGIRIKTENIFKEKDYNYFGAFYGKCRTLFGEPNKETREYECMYIYCIKAAAANGRYLYFCVLNNAGGPAVSFPSEENGFDTAEYYAAIKELISKIYHAPVSDYEWKGHTTYGAPRFFRFSVKNGETCCSPLYIDEVGLLKNGCYFEAYDEIYKEFY